MRQIIILVFLFFSVFCFAGNGDGSQETDSNNYLSIEAEIPVF